MAWAYLRVCKYCKQVKEVAGKYGTVCFTCRTDAASKKYKEVNK